jgi:hypothetical protein
MSAQMTNTDVLGSKLVAPRLQLVAPLIAAICYPLFLRGCYGSMQLFAAGQSPLDRFAAIFSFVVSLAAAFAVPLTAALCAQRIARLPLNAPGTVRAYRFAHLAFAVPPLFTALGVITGVAGLNADSPGIGALALAVLLIFLIAHLVNHLLGLWNPALHGRVMHALEVIYRAYVVEPALALCMLLLIVTGLTLAWRHTAIQGDGYRRVQTLTGVYLAAFILSHMTAVFVYARWRLYIQTDWAFASGAPTGLLRDAFNVRLIPHYAIAPWAVVTHVGLGLRGVLRAHGVAERSANSWAKGMSAVGAIVSILITLGLIGVHLGGS